MVALQAESRHRRRRVAAASPGQRPYRRRAAEQKGAQQQRVHLCRPHCCLLLLESAQGCLQAERFASSSPVVPAGELGGRLMAGRTVDRRSVQQAVRQALQSALPDKKTCWRRRRCACCPPLARLPWCTHRPLFANSSLRKCHRIDCRPIQLAAARFHWPPAQPPNSLAHQRLPKPCRLAWRPPACAAAAAACCGSQLPQAAAPAAAACPQAALRRRQTAGGVACSACWRPVAWRPSAAAPPWRPRRWTRRRRWGAGRAFCVWSYGARQPSLHVPRLRPAVAFAKRPNMRASLRPIRPLFLNTGAGGPAVA